jgi:tRNA(Arg) A34 adenosine deaminase TadA
MVVTLELCTVCAGAATLVRLIYGTTDPP